jgi:hypothetical protein
MIAALEAEKESPPTVALEAETHPPRLPRRPGFHPRPRDGRGRRTRRRDPGSRPRGEHAGPPRARAPLPRRRGARHHPVQLPREPRLSQVLARPRLRRAVHPQARLEDAALRPPARARRARRRLPKPQFLPRPAADGRLPATRAWR